MSSRVCGIYEFRCMGSLVIQVQVYSVGPGVIMVHIARPECCWCSHWVLEYVESINPGICMVSVVIQKQVQCIGPEESVDPDLHLEIQPRI